jgi:predicted phosphohydrolase
MLLATLLFHRPMLAKLIHPNHPYWKCKVNKLNENMVATLSGYISIEEDEIMTARGVSAITRLFKTVKQNQVDNQLQFREILSIVKTTAAEQEKLSDLIPLSAAASGMVVGNRQMEQFEGRLQAHYDASHEALLKKLEGKF